MCPSVGPLAISENVQNSWYKHINSYFHLLLDFSLSVKAATLIFISGCGSAISSAKKGKSGCIYNSIKS